MKIRLLILHCLSVFTLYSQDSILFKIETLEPPIGLIEERRYIDAIKEIVKTEKSISDYKNEYNYNFITPIDTNLFIAESYGHPFFEMLEYAYKDHKTITISPDDIWLLISQGFSFHVNANYEKLRPKLVDFNDKKDLVVYSNSINLNDSKENWSKEINKLKVQLDSNLKDSLGYYLSANFSTTSYNDKTVSAITSFYSFERFFNFIVVKFSCGIPYVNLKGKPDDWKNIIEKTKKLENYDLKWWTDELNPILEKIYQSSLGNHDTIFWQKIFKSHSQKVYGNPNKYDGWIVKFFPYNNKFIKNNLKDIVSNSQIPSGFVKAKIKFIDDSAQNTHTLEAYSGFTGFSQNHKTYSLTPIRDWFIRIENSDTNLVHKLKENDNFGGIRLYGTEIPIEIFDIDTIRYLSFIFSDKIQVPEKISKQYIKHIVFIGSILESEKYRIANLVPNSFLEINNEHIPTKEHPIKRNLKKESEEKEKLMKKMMENTE